MLMSKFSNIWLILLLTLLLGACSSKPAPAPQPEPAPEPEQAAEAAPAPEPADFNQQFYEQAITALKNGDIEVAIELLLLVSTEAPEKPFIFTNLGLAYFNSGQLEQAEAAFQQAIARDSRDAVAHNHLGILQRQKGEFASARESYERAIRINQDYALAHLNLGILFDIYLQDLELALRHYQRYQTLQSEENTQVAGWIVDIERRLKSGGAQS
jgi:tetratricopeptide (TPR) repeat protein